MNDIFINQTSSVKPNIKNMTCTNGKCKVLSLILLLLFTTVMLNVITVIALFNVVMMGSPFRTEGTGDHYVIFCHGVGGTSNDFVNLKKGFDLKRFTLIFQGFINDNRMVTSYHNIDQSIVELVNEIDRIIKNGGKNKQSKKIKMSVIGHSFGGLYAKLLIHKINQIDVIDENVKLVNFINFATPHYGIIGSSQYDNFKIWILPVILNEIGEYLITPPNNSTNHVIERFENKINYVNAHLDPLIPFWSGSMKLNETSLDYVNIKEYETNMSMIKWRTFTVPLLLHSFLNHGNIIGKYLDKSRKHGDDNFNNIEKILDHFNKWFV